MNNTKPTLTVLRKSNGTAYKCNGRRVYRLIDQFGIESFILANAHHRWNEYLYNLDTWNRIHTDNIAHSPRVQYPNLQAAMIQDYSSQIAA